MNNLLAVLVFSCLGFSVSFVVPPSISKQNDSLIRISFTVSETTDVTVWIAGDSDKVIRHLASGRLGRKAPAPLQANSLSQQIDWNLKNDNGITVTDSFEVKVGIGIRAKFGRIYGGENQNILSYYPSVSGLAVDAQGNVIVLASSSLNRTGIFMFSGEGQYIRTIMPYPSNLPEESVKGYGRMKLTDGSRIPVVYQGHTGAVVPEIALPSRQGMAVTPQGWLVLSNEINSGMYGGVNDWGGAMAKVRRALIVGLDGSCPRDTIYGPMFSNTTDAGPLFFAVSPDGKKLYGSGLKKGRWVGWNSQNSVQSAVWRADINTLSQADTFVGDPNLSDNDDYHFMGPHGIAVDTLGNVYVADYSNDRVMIYDSNRVFINKIAIINPDHISINRKTGDIYVVSLPASGVLKITKFAGLPALTQVFAYNSTYSTNSPPISALDQNSVPVRLWITPFNGENRIRCLEDNGTSFVISQRVVGTPAGSQSIPDGGNTPCNISLNKEGNSLVCGTKGTFATVDLKSGVIKRFQAPSNAMQYGADGFLYGYGKEYTNGSVKRYTATGVQTAFPDGNMVFNNIGQDFKYQCQPWGWTIDQNNNFYLAQFESRTTHHTYVVRFDSIGRVRDTLFSSVGSLGGAPLNGIGFDPAGNLFIGMNIRPFGVFYPKGYATGQSFLTPLHSYHYTWPYAAVNYYGFQIGCVLKLPPKGVQIVRRDTYAPNQIPMGNLNGDTVPLVQVDGLYTHAYDIKGKPAWQYFGVSPICHEPTLGDPQCICHRSSFEVDGFGRVLAPDAFRFSVIMLDNSGNEMMRIGKYGNQDARGPQSTQPIPEIPIGFARYVNARANSVYISDDVNVRILRADYDYDFTWSSKSGLINDAENMGGRTAFLGKLAVNVFPQPLRFTATVAVNNPQSGNVTVSLYDMKGRLLKTLVNGKFSSGQKILTIDGRDDGGRQLSNGIYLLKIKTAKEELVRNITVMR